MRPAASPRDALSACGRNAPVYRFCLKHLKVIGWRLFTPAVYVRWCRYGQEFIPWPERDDWVRLVPIVGEAV